MNAATATETAPETKAAKAKAVETTGDFIADTAIQIAGYSKTKALNRIDSLIAGEGESDFELGGLFLQLNNQNWYEGSPSFDEFVALKFKIHPRKARYLMGIYKELVDKMIPWAIVKNVGWTKLREIARAGVLTADNAQEWADKAEKLTVVELIKVLKTSGSGDGSPSASTKDDVQTLKFKFKNDQIETANSALAKAKAEGNTEFDNVAAELIFQSYLSGGTGQTLEQLLTAAGVEDSLKAFDKCFPGWTITVDPPEEEETATE